MVDIPHEVIQNYDLDQVDEWRKLICGRSNSEQTLDAVASYCSRPRTEGGPELLIVERPLENGFGSNALFVDLTPFNQDAFRYFLGKIQLQISDETLGRPDHYRLYLAIYQSRSS